MPDTREDMLLRLLTVCAAVSGIATAARNVTEFEDAQLPGVGILEGDEFIQPLHERKDAGPSYVPQVVTATPHLLLRCKESSELGGYRLRIIDAVLGDAALNALTFKGRGIRYVGQQSTLAVGRSMIVSSALLFSFTYLLIPTRPSP